MDTKTKLAERNKFDADIVQFMRPHGNQAPTTTELSSDVLALYCDMTECGFRLEAEVLMNGMVSVTIADKDEDIDCRIVPNGPEVQEALEMMLRCESWNTK